MLSLTDTAIAQQEATAITFMNRNNTFIFYIFDSSEFFKNDLINRLKIIFADVLSLSSHTVFNA